MTLRSKMTLALINFIPSLTPKMSPRISSIVQIIFLCRSFEIIKDSQSVQNANV